MRKNKPGHHGKRKRPKKKKYVGPRCAKCQRKMVGEEPADLPCPNCGSLERVIDDGGEEQP